MKFLVQSSLQSLLTALLILGFVSEVESQDRPPRRGMPDLAEPVVSFGAAVSGEYL